MVVNKPGAGRPTSFWTKERIKILKASYPSQSNEEVSALLGITVSAVRNGAVRFKVKKKDRYWTKSEEDYILKNWAVMSAVKIAEKLSKTRYAVVNKYRELTGLR